MSHNAQTVPVRARLGNPVDFRCHGTMLAAFEYRPLGIKVFLHSSDSLARPAFYGSGKVLIAGSDRLHADVDYTNKESPSWNCDCCAGATTDASYACLTRLEMTSQTYFKQYEESNEYSAATFWEQLATERVCIKLTWIQALQCKYQC